MTNQKKVVEEITLLEQTVKTTCERVCQLEVTVNVNNKKFLDVIGNLIQKVRIFQDKTNEKMSELEAISKINHNNITEMKSRLDKTVMKAGEIMPQLETTIHTNQNILKGLSHLEKAVRIYHQNSNETMSHFKSISSQNENNVSEIMHRIDKTKKTTSEKMSQLETAITTNQSNVLGEVHRLENAVKESQRNVDERLNQLQETISINHNNIAKRMICLEETVQKTGIRMSVLEESINSNQNNVARELTYLEIPERMYERYTNNKIVRQEQESFVSQKNATKEISQIDLMIEMCNKIPQLEATISQNQEIVLEGMNRLEWFMDSIYTSNIIERITLLEDSVNRALSVLPKVEALLSPNISEKPPIPHPMQAVATTPSSSSSSSTADSTRTSTFNDSTSASTSVASTPLASTADSNSTSNNDFAPNPLNGFNAPSSSASPAESVYSTANSSTAPNSPAILTVQSDRFRERKAPHSVIEDWWLTDSPVRINNDLRLSLRNVRENHQNEFSQQYSEDNYANTKEYDADNSLFIACRSDNIRRLRMLIKTGANVNRRDSSGCTPLHVASALGHVECVKILLSAGADKDTKDNCGVTPLDLASKEDIREVLQHDRRFQTFLNRFLNRK